MSAMSRMIRGGVFLMGVILIGCGPQGEVERLIKRELATGVRNDSLFVGVYFGMEKQEFYDQ